jgi:hypothetical protein
MALIRTREYGRCQVVRSQRTLACKAWADRVPQYAADALARKIFGDYLELFVVVCGSVLHGRYITRWLVLTSYGSLRGVIERLDARELTPGCASGSRNKMRASTRSLAIVAVRSGR